MAKLKAKCNKCGKNAVINFGDNVESLNATEPIVIDRPCPSCGEGNFSAPSGQYAVNDAGILEITNN